MFNVKRQGGIALALLLGVLVLGLTSCGGGGGTVAQRYADAYGKGKPSAVPSVTVEFDNGYDIIVTGKVQVSGVELTFATGQVEAYKLNKQGACHSANTAPLTNVKVLSKSGDYWYFDRTGLPLPVEGDKDADKGAAGLLGNVVGGTLGLVGDVLNPSDVVKLVMVSTSPFRAKLFAEGSSLKSAKLVFANGKTQAFNLGGSYGTVFNGTGHELSYVEVTQGSGSKWFFDRGGQVLPGGYKPTITINVFSSDGADSTKMSSGRKTGNKHTSLLLSNIVSVTSSDTYSEIKVGLADTATATFQTNATSGEYDTQSTAEVEAVRVTLAADGSKWYFDSLGNMLPLDSKWYTDLD